MRTLTGLSCDSVRRLRPSGHQHKAVVDQSLFTKTPLPGVGCEMHMPLRSSTLEAHKRQTGGTNEIRQYLVFTVPSRLLDHNASKLEHYNLSDTEACEHSHALAFFLYALETAVTLDSATIYTWIELVVADSKDLPITHGPHMTMTYDMFRQEDAKDRTNYRALSSRCDDIVVRGNMTGYRLWVGLTSSAYDVEVLLRMALLRVQCAVGMCEPAVTALKLRYTTIPTESERLQQIKADVKKRMDAEKEKKAKRGAKDDDGDGSGGGDDDADSAAADTLDAQAQAIEQAIAKPPSASARNGIKDQADSVGMQFVSINTMQSYIDMFLMPLAQQMYSKDHVDEIRHQMGAVYSKVAMRWGESVRLDMLDPPLGHVLSACEMLSFSATISTLCHDGVCPAQSARSSYFDDAGRLSFPLPDLVRSISAVHLSPDEFMAELLPWYRRRFHEQLSKLIAYNAADTRERNRRIEAANVGLHSGTVRHMMTGVALRTPPATASHSSSSSSSSSDARARMAESQGLGSDGDNDTFTPDEEALFTRNIDPLQTLMRERDSCTVTQHVFTDITNLRKQFKAEWLKAVTEVDKMITPDNITNAKDKQAYKDTMLNILNGLREEEHMAVLLQLLNSSTNINEYHRQAFRAISAHTDLSSLVHPVVSIEPTMTLAANSLVHRLMLSAAAIKLRGGYIELLDSVFVQGLQAAMPHLQNAEHMLIVGPPGTGKSLVAERSIQQGVAGATRRCDHNSKLAAYTDTTSTGYVDHHDEAPPTVCRITNKQAESDDYPRMKANLSLGEIQFMRNVRTEEGKYIMHSVVAERVFVKNMLTNSFTVGAFSRGPQPDMAIPDRMVIVPFVVYPSQEKGDRAVNVVADRRTEEAEQLYNMIAERQRNEMSLTVMVMLAARTGVLTQINTDVIKMMQTASWNVLENWSRWMCSSMRAQFRAHNYGATLLYTTAVSAITRAESGPLVQWVRDPDTQRPVPHVRSFTLADVPRLFGPYLCATVDHGLWSVFRSCHSLYPFVLYNVAMAAAHVLCRYRRSWMEVAYRVHNIPIMDDDLRKCWRRCGLPTTAWPAFLQYTLDWETELRNDVVQQHGLQAAPLFVSGLGDFSAGGADLNNMNVSIAEAAAVGTYSSVWMERSTSQYNKGHDPIDHTKITPAKVREERTSDAIRRSLCYNPNLLETGLNIGDLSKEIVSALRRRLVVDAKYVESMLQLLSTIRVTVPLFANINKNGCDNTIPMPHDLMPIRDSVGQNSKKIRYDENASVVSFRYNAAKRCDTIVFSSTALMFMPQMAVCLMLRAFEKNTRPRDTVLLCEVPEHPDKLCAWQVCKQKDNELVLPAVGEIGTLSQRSIAHSAAGMDAVSSHAFKFANSNPGAQHFNDDIEQEAFKRHMTALYQTMPMGKALELLMASDDEKVRTKCKDIYASYAARNPMWEEGTDMLAPSDTERKQLFEMWCDLHPARPGSLEVERDELYRTMPELGSITRTTSYPRTHIVDNTVSRALGVILRSASCVPLHMSEKQDEEYVARCNFRITSTRKRIDSLRQKQAEAKDAPQDVANDMEERRRKLAAQLEALTIELRHYTMIEHTYSTDAAASQRVQSLDMAKRSLMWIICSEPWFSKHSLLMRNEISWSPLFVRVFETVLESSTPTAPVPSDIVLSNIAGSWSTVPGLILVSERPCYTQEDAATVASVRSGKLEFEFDLNCLHWLEHALWLDDTLEEMALVYATDTSIATYADTQRAMVKLGGERPAVVMANAKARILECRTHFVESGGNCSAEDALVLKRHQDALDINRRVRILFNQDQHKKWDTMGRIAHSVRVADVALSKPSLADSISNAIRQDCAAAHKRLQGVQNDDDSLLQEAASALAALPSSIRAAAQ